MAIAQSGVKLRFDGEGNADQFIGGLIGQIDKLKSSITSGFGSNITQLISITAIEEGIRRTGEWASELTRTASELGQNTRNMQALQLAAEKSGVGADRLITFYDKLESSILAAYQGQLKFNTALKGLGVDLKDTSKTKGEIFTDIINKIGSSPAGKYDAESRLIFGKGYGDILRLSHQIGGNVNSYADTHKDIITPSETVSQLSNTYRQIIQDFKEIGTILTPFANVILGIVGGLVGMLKGLVFAVVDLVKGALGFFEHPIETLINAFENVGLIGQGLMKMTLGIIDFLANHSILKLIPGFNSNLKGGAAGWFDAHTPTDISQERRKNYEQVGNALGTALMVGDSVFGETPGFVDSLITNPIQKSAISIGARKAVAQAIQEARTNMGYEGELAGMSSLSKEQITNDAISKFQKTFAYKGMMAMGYTPETVAAYVAREVNQPDKTDQIPDPTTLGDLLESTNEAGDKLEAITGGSSAFAQGGIFGTDVVSRLVSLNEQSVNYLAAIAANTARYNNVGAAVGAVGTDNNGNP